MAMFAMRLWCSTWNPWVAVLPSFFKHGHADFALPTTNGGYCGVFWRKLVPSFAVSFGAVCVRLCRIALPEFVMSSFLIGPRTNKAHLVTVGIHRKRAFGVWMSVLASRIKVGMRAPVLLAREHVEMVRVAAKRYFAPMVKLKSFWDITDKHYVGSFMNKHGGSVFSGNDAVTVPRNPSFPYPAVGFDSLVFFDAYALSESEKHRFRRSSSFHKQKPTHTLKVKSADKGGNQDASRKAVCVLSFSRLLQSREWTLTPCYS